MKNLKNKKSKEKNIDNVNILDVALILGYVIVIPLVAGVLLGNWLDEKFSSRPVFLLVSVLVAIIFSSIFLVVKLKKYLK
jgi:F0F1-type ATP synthase assembly protein I